MSCNTGYVGMGSCAAGSNGDCPGGTYVHLKYNFFSIHYSSNHILSFSNIPLYVYTCVCVIQIFFKNMNIAW